MVYYLYRVKRLFRNKILFFWSIIFPLVLATFFKLAFSSITEKDWGFETIAIAVTAEEGAEADVMLVSFLEEMENEGTPFFAVTETDRAQAEEMLSEKEVTAVIVTGEETKLFLEENGLNSTVVKTVVDGYLQSKDIFIEAAMTGKLAEVTEVFSAEMETLAVREYKGASKDPMIQYFQALIAMASLYGAMYGLMNTNELNQNITDVAARRLAAPMRKIPTVLADVAAAFSIQYVQFLIILAYYTLILHVDFGTVNGWLFLAGAAYSLFGVLIGYFIGCAVQKKDNVQNAIMMGCVMFSCFLAGLMVGNLRITIELSMPIINRINPATLVAESMQALCVMGDRKRFARCMISILVWCICLGAGSVIAMMLRQQKSGKEARKA
ncbi:MAG: ABC transporter permease [Lachnospiraceae bacterium]|nr:ABC transporter permease [Lachnospiraceae bacterium]